MTDRHNDRIFMMHAPLSSAIGETLFIVRSALQHESLCDDKVSMPSLRLSKLIPLQGVLSNDL